MSTINECPICLDCIEINKNFITTECGHCFHANCLMTSIAHNGFACPYCRTAMAEEPDDDDITEYESVDDEVDPLNDNDTLRGFRFFFNNVYGNEHDENDVEDENSYEDDEVEEDLEPKPSASFITQKLVERGVTMEQLVKTILSENHEEYEDDEEMIRISDELFGKVRIIVSNYNPAQIIQPVVAPQPIVVAHPVVEIDSNAQPKTRRIQVTRNHDAYL